MQRKHKIALISAIYLPFAIIIPVLLNITFTHSLLFLTKISFLFALPCLAFFILPIKTHCIGEHQSPSTYTTLQWLCIILTIEVGFLALWLNQNALFLQNILLTNTINQLSTNVTNHILLTTSLLNGGLFPWTLICFIGITFAYISDKHGVYSPFSHSLPKWPTTFLHKISKAIADNYISVSTKLFLSFNIIFLVLRTTHFLTHSIFTPIDGMVIVNILLLLFLGKSFQQNLDKFEKYKLPLGFQYILIFILTVIVTLATKLFIHFLPQEHMADLNKNLSAIILSLQNATLAWELWNWSWWILAIPLASSLLLKFSTGRKVGSFIIAVLAPPIFLLAFSFLWPNQLGQWLIILTRMSLPSVASFLLSLIFVAYLLINTESTFYLVFGFFPMRKPQKSHKIRLEKIKQQIWLFVILLMGMTLIGGIIAVQLITIPVTLACLVIFLMLMVLIGFRK